MTNYLNKVIGLILRGNSVGLVLKETVDVPSLYLEKCNYLNIIL